MCLEGSPPCCSTFLPHGQSDATELLTDSRFSAPLLSLPLLHGRTRRPPAIPTNMQWFFVQKPTAAAYSRLHASAAACLTVAADPLPAQRGRRRHLNRSARGLFAPWRAGGEGSRSSDPSSAAEDHRPLGQQDTGTGENTAAVVALFQKHGGDVDGEYVRLVVSEFAGENPGEELGFLLLLLSMVQIGGAPNRRTELDSWPVLLACKQGGVSAPMRWVNLRLPHPERLSSSFSSSSSSASCSSSFSSSPVSAKSMRFIWSNIFSKGSHMLQCLCGRSLKKPKNPTGEFVCKCVPVIPACVCL